MVCTVARSLGRRGVPVIHIAMGAGEGRSTSRYLQESAHLSSEHEMPGRFEAFILETTKRWPGALVLPLNDRALVSLARARDDMQPALRIGCPPAEVVAQTIDKERMAVVAARLGISVPRSFELPTMASLDEVAAKLPWPMFAKLRTKIGNARLMAEFPFGVALYQDQSALRAAFAAASDHGAHFIFQEYCPGHDVLLSVLMHEGRVVAAFQSRSLRTWPSTGGVTVLTRSEPVDPVLCEQFAALLRALRWEGIAQSDWRRDPATGRTVLLEINGRFWGSISAAVHAGVDFPYYIWQLAHGRTPSPPAGYRAGMETHWAMGDVKRLVRLWRNPAPGESRWRELIGLLVLFRPGVRGMMWAWDDPTPAWSEWTADIKWFLWARARDVWRRLFPAEKSRGTSA